MTMKFDAYRADANLADPGGVSKAGARALGFGEMCRCGHDYGCHDDGANANSCAVHGCNCDSFVAERVYDCQTGEVRQRLNAALTVIGTHNRHSPAMQAAMAAIDEEFSYRGALKACRDLNARRIAHLVAENRSLRGQLAAAHRLLADQARECAKLFAAMKTEVRGWK